MLLLQLAGAVKRTAIHHMTGNRWHLKLTALLVIPAIFLLFHNRVSNWHYHVLHNGMVVEHAHPFKHASKSGTPFQSHQHSEAEFLILSELSNVLTMLVVALVIAGMMLETIARHTRLPAPVFVSKHHYTSRQLRAPPVISA